MMKPIYLDYNATTPLDPEVAEAMQPYIFEHFGNPSSSHCYGTEAKKAIEKARLQLAALINCMPGEIIFTSGGTESNNFAIKGSALYLKDKGNHIITSSIEHPAVHEVCNYLKNKGFEISYVPVDEFGMISLKDIEKEIKPTTILISIMHANNEIGTIQPIEEIGNLAKKHNIRFHTDAAQTIGKIKADVTKLGVDLLSIAGHKFYAPKGIGALDIKEGTLLEKFMHGAAHEQNLRAGTENVLGIVGLGIAAEIVNRDFEEVSLHLKELGEYFYQNLQEKNPGIQLNGHPKNRLLNTFSISFKEKKAIQLLQKMEALAASAGAACHSDKIEVSHVLKSIKLPEELSAGTIRFSLGKFLTHSDIDEAIKTITDALKG